MLIFKRQKDLKAWLKGKNRIGFVPTMGALHEGHIKLLERAKSENEICGCSIFVNPTQFNNQADFEKYPVRIEKDLSLLLEAGCDFLFLPPVAEMYPEGTQSSFQYDLGYLDTVLEGEHRPGHFNGVCTIVHKLLKAVMPHNLYMGEKDFQQCMVVRRLLTLSSLPVNLVICPTLRHDDGLAMSSRNLRLSRSGRQIANTIFDCLCYISENKHHFPFQTLKNECLEKLSGLGFETEYLCLADAENLDLMDEFDHQREMVVLIASRLEGIRLIDNMKV